MKIKEEELKTIQEQQKKLNDIYTNVGLLETQKHGLLHEVALLNKDIEETKKDLEEKYGQVNISLEDGSYVEIKDNVEDKED